jgi:hypothetical protein
MSRALKRAALAAEYNFLIVVPEHLRQVVSGKSGAGRLNDVRQGGEAWGKAPAVEYILSNVFLKRIWQVEESEKYWHY